MHSRLHSCAIALREHGDRWPVKPGWPGRGWSEWREGVISLFRHHIPVSTTAQVLADGMLLYLAMILAAHVAGGPQVATDQITGAAMVYALTAVAIGSTLGLYKRGNASFGELAARVIVTVLVATGAAAMLLRLGASSEQALGALGYAALYSLAGLILLRQVLVSAKRAGIGRRPVLIVGTGDDARAVQVALQSGSSRSSIVGFYQTNRDDSVVVDPSSPLFSDKEELSDVVRRLGVRQVIVALRDQRGGALPMRQLLDCRISGVPVLDLAAFYEREHGQVPVETLKSSWLIYGQGFAQSRMRALVKRVFDIVCSLLLLILAAPVMAITALAIALESGRPVFYTQQRVGRGGKLFDCIKFRSMRTDAEKDGVARWAVAGDQRVTRVGRILRKARIDELPQLFNVLRGDMSLVGPRPERPAFVAELARQIPFYDVRHSVKPGVTGWAQVRYTYGASVEEAKRKLQYDLYYVKNHSLFLDVLILIETVRVVITGEGAQ
jgi:sugar transferase (PEP-CTERM system associated)